MSNQPASFDSALAAQNSIELARLRQTMDDLAEVLERFDAGAVSAHYVVGWVEAALRRVRT